MLVGRRMTREVVTVRPEDKLLAAEEAMKKGGFRSVPVVTNGKLVGIITDRDLRRHEGFFEQTRVDATMTENPLTVTPQTTLEQAALLLLRHKIGSLPVIEEGKLVGIITTSDMLRAFLEVIGASEEGGARVDLLLEGEGRDLAEASKVIAGEEGEVLGVGIYREKWGESPVCYLRFRGADPDRVAALLKGKGYTVLGIYV